jgi:ABC-type multidrug transport system fused ATPase/permease subunit
LQHVADVEHMNSRDATRTEAKSSNLAVISISEIEQHHWRKRIALVSQNPLFVSLTVRDNICYGMNSLTEKELTDDEIFACARSIDVLDFLVGLPLGLDTVIGEDGVGVDQVIFLPIRPPST